jgi:RNA-binding protein
MTSKERASLRGLANRLDAVMQIGKQGVTPEVVSALHDVLEARELVKLTLLANCETEPAEAAQMLAERTKAAVVQVIGKKIVFYRESKKKKEKK